MNKQRMLVFGIVVFLVLMMPVMISGAQAYNKHGPTPIPGNLIPFPTKIHDKHNPIISPVIPSTTK